MSNEPESIDSGPSEETTKRKKTTRKRKDVKDDRYTPLTDIIDYDLDTIKKRKIMESMGLTTSQQHLEKPTQDDNLRPSIPATEKAKRPQLLTRYTSTVGDPDKTNRPVITHGFDYDVASNEIIATEKEEVPVQKHQLPPREEQRGLFFTDFTDTVLPLNELGPSVGMPSFGIHSTDRTFDPFLKGLGDTIHTDNERAILEHEYNKVNNKMKSMAMRAPDNINISSTATKKKKNGEQRLTASPANIGMITIGWKFGPVARQPLKEISDKLAKREQALLYKFLQPKISKDSYCIQLIQDAIDNNPFFRGTDERKVFDNEFIDFGEPATPLYNADYLRAPIPANGERPCRNGAYCRGKLIFSNYPNDKTNPSLVDNASSNSGVILREYIRPSDYKRNITKPQPGKCLLCKRFYVTKACALNMQSYKQVKGMCLNTHIDAEGPGGYKREVLLPTVIQHADDTYFTGVMGPFVQYNESHYTQKLFKGLPGATGVIKGFVEVDFLFA